MLGPATKIRVTETIFVAAARASDEVITDSGQIRIAFRWYRRLGAQIRSGQHRGFDVARMMRDHRLHAPKQGRRTLVRREVF